jgi:ABC-2 type transport system permease protein
VRHFTEAMQCMVYFDGGISTCWPQLAVLCVFPLLAVVLLHFKNENEDENENENENLYSR